MGVSVSRVAPCPSGSCLQGVLLFQLWKQNCGCPLDTDPKEQHLPLILQEIFLLPQVWPKTGFCVSTTCVLQALPSPLASCSLGTELGQQEGKASILDR